MPRPTRTELRLRREAQTHRKWTKRKLVAAVTAGLLLISAVALASDADTSVADVTAPTSEVELSPGDSAPIVITVTVTGRQDNPATFEILKDWTLAGDDWTGANAQSQLTPTRAAQDDAHVYTFTGTVAVDGDQECSALDGDGSLIPFTLEIGVNVTATSSPATLGARNKSAYDVFVVDCDNGEPDPAFTIDGFYQPVQNAVTNGAKAGRVIPLKFNILDEGNVKQEDVDLVDVFVMKAACNGGAENDLLTSETLASGKTELRWDSVAEQFVYNWKTPKSPGCYRIRLEVEGDFAEVEFMLS